MENQTFIAIALILGLGTLAQIASWHLRIPPIILLILFGLGVGPVGGWIDPDQVFGDLLFPLASFCVGIILFEGGLSLKLKELRGSGGIIFRLVSLGILITWGLASILAFICLGFSPVLAMLTGAILTVTGPTVIGPILRIVRPQGKVNSIAKWEGILNDPIGAVLAVLIFEAVFIHQGGNVPGLYVLKGMGITLIIGFGVGAMSAFLLIWFLRSNIVPEYLHNKFTLGMVGLAFIASNLVQHESGLLTVTIMGIILANQSKVDISHIISFKESLKTFILSFLFITLASRVSKESIHLIDMGNFLFLAGLIILVRPLAVWASSFGGGLNVREKLFLCLMAPRGIVVAAVSTVFALRLESLGNPEANAFLANIIFVILGTVILYGIVAAPAARLLKVANSNPRGLLFIGAHHWSRTLSQKLNELGTEVHLVDSNPQRIQQASEMGLHTYLGNVFNTEFLESINFSNIRAVVALTANDEVNAFAETTLAHFGDHFEVLHLAPEKDSHDPFAGKKNRFKPAFHQDCNFGVMEKWIRTPNALQHCKLENANDTLPEGDLLLFSIDKEGRPSVIKSQEKRSFRAGTTVIYLKKE